MSTAARKARKRIRKRWNYESAEATRSYPIAGPYQHPTREGIPYGRSKQPRPMPLPERLPPLGVLPEFRGWIR